jgi:ankyrin repeat protein
MGSCSAALMCAGALSSSKEGDEEWQQIELFAEMLPVGFPPELDLEAARTSNLHNMVVPLQVDSMEEHAATAASLLRSGSAPATLWSWTLIGEQNMSKDENLTNAIDAALNTARSEYRKAVLDLATHEASKDISSDREPADVDRIHQARTRVIALDAAREELAHMIDEGPLLSS